MDKAKHHNRLDSLWHLLFLRFRAFGMAQQSAFLIQNLAVLLEAGMSITQALDSVIDEVDSWRLRSAVRDVQKDIRDGRPLSTALEQARIASPYSVSLIRLGEQSGRLAKNLAIAAEQNEKEAIFRSRVRSALAYSTFVLTVAAVVGIGISWFILPQVASFFQEAEAELPLLTVLIIETGIFLRDYGFIILPFFCIVILVVFYFLFSFPKTRFIGHTILFHLPAIGKLIRETEISRFGFIVGSMISAGVPLQQIFALLPSTTTFRNYSRLYTRLDADIVEGKTFKQIFADNKKVKKLFPLAVRQMIIGAEQSGTLGKTFTAVGEMYATKVEITSRSIPTFLEPLLLLLIGGIVAILALGILMPIYQLGLYL